ncbi:ankyrin repeat-containing domain protein [Pelagophyceae sp. CCMP2097]|nr:ankyrin repeat-containing domain protein [Pelagophyceae sp. CCMP2097]
MDSGQLAQVDNSLLQACLEGNFKAVDHAMQNGANAPRARDPMGATVLHMAALGGHVKMGRWCVQQGALKAATDAQGLLPLHFAAYNGHVAMLSWLAGTGADRALRVGACDAQGATPLHHAGLGGALTALRWLLNHGADERAVTVDGLTAEQVAHEAGEDGAVGLLRAFRAHMRHEDPERPPDLPPQLRAQEPEPAYAVSPTSNRPAGVPPPPPAEDDDGMDAAERLALADAEKEAEQFRRAEMDRLLFEEEARRRAEGDEAARRLVAQEASRRAADRARVDQAAQKASQEAEWMMRYQAECAKREAEREVTQAQTDATAGGATAGGAPAAAAPAAADGGDEAERRRKHDAEDDEAGRRKSTRRR